MHRVPQYLRHSSGQARVVINGKAHYLGRHGSAASKRRYDALITEYLNSQRSPLFGVAESQAMLVQDLMLAYLRHAKVYYGTQQNSDYSRIKGALKVVAELYTDIEVSQFNSQRFKAVRQRMIDKGWARTTINQNCGHIKRMVKWGAAEGHYPAAIYDALRIVPNLQAGRTEDCQFVRRLPICATQLVLPICAAQLVGLGVARRPRSASLLPGSLGPAARKRLTAKTIIPREIPQLASP